MDRDNRWDRVAAAYNLIVDSSADHTAASAVEGLEAAYARGESDEFVKATRIGEAVTVEDGDAVIFMNFRADRARELSRVFVEPDFNEFARTRQPKVAAFIGLTQYSAKIPAPAAFVPASLDNVLGEYLAKTARPNCGLPKPRSTPTSPSSSPVAAKSRSKAKNVSSSRRPRLLPMTCSPR